MKKFPADILTIAGMAIFLAAGCNDKPPPPAPKPTAVTVSPAVDGKVPRQLTAIGSIKAFVSVDLTARVSGYLIERNFRDGQFVKKGDTLYRIEPYQYEAAVKVAQGNLGVAVSSRKNAEITLQRQKDLVGHGATSIQDYDNALAAKIEADSNVMVMEGQLEQAQLNLLYTNIAAPFDGYVGLNKYDVGNLVSPDSGTLTSIADSSKVLVQFVLADSDLRALGEYLGSPALFNSMYLVLSMEDGGKYAHPGVIVRSDNRIDTSTGTAALQALFPNPDGKLTPGQFVMLHILTHEKDDLLLVPRIAVLYDQRGGYVWVADADGKARRHDLTITHEFDRFVAVSQGIKKDEAVIIDNLMAMRENSAVSVGATTGFSNELAELAGTEAAAIPVYSAKDAYLGQSDMYGKDISAMVKADTRSAVDSLESEFLTPPQAKPPQEQKTDGAATEAK